MRSPRWDAPAASPLAKLKTGTLDSPLGYRNGSSGSLATADAFQATMLAADGEDALEKGAPKLLLLSPRLFAAHYLYPLLRYITVSSPSTRRGAPSPAPGAAAPPAPEQQQQQQQPCGSTLTLRLPPPLRPLPSLLRRVLTPVWLSLALLLLLALPSWWGALARLPLPPPHARGVPVLAIPMSTTRGATLLATLSAIDVRVETLLLCDSAPGVPELECVAAEVTARAARGELPVGEVRVVFPRGAQQGGGAAAGPVYGVSECWNSLAREAFAMEDARAPWMLVMNDDVGFSEGTLALSVAAIWGAFKGKSLLLANDGLPGVGYAFSAYALTREGYAALGPFDENFYPAYYEDCDYIRRADLLPSLPWVRIPWMRLLHPIQAHLPAPPALSASVAACMGAAEVERREFAAAVAGGAAALLHRARSPTAWAAFPFSDRHYYARKWGGPLNQCGKGEFAAPFGRDAGSPLGEWPFDEAMRVETVKGSALEGLRPPARRGTARAA